MKIILSPNLSKSSADLPPWAKQMFKVIKAAMSEKADAEAMHSSSGQACTQEDAKAILAAFRAIPTYKVVKRTTTDYSVFLKIHAEKGVKVVVKGEDSSVSFWET